MSGLLTWLCGRNQKSDLEAQIPRRTVIEQCVFCQASSSNRHAFDIVWEDADFLAFRDRRPASLHHIQLITKAHIGVSHVLHSVHVHPSFPFVVTLASIGSVKELTKRDTDTVKRMETIGNEILAQLEIHPSHRKMGFHIPPFNSVQHLHLHVQALPYISFTRRVKYPIARGFATFDKGFSWFAEVGPTIRILEKGSTVGTLPC